MARPTADLRQKALIPTVFSNTRIGKLGKERPWIFQSWAGALARSDAYGIFKWEPERMAILIWPYNPERQETFEKDLDLLADGPEQERLIQKYEVGGVWYGRFPKFEEHNALERRHEPRFPFPPGVVPPPGPPLENEKRNGKGKEPAVNPRLTEVNSNGSVPVLEKTAGETPATPANEPKAAPVRIGFDPFNVEVPGVQPDEVRRVAAYWWKHAKSKFWRDRVTDRQFFIKHFTAMAEKLPYGWQPPKEKVPVRPAQPNCDKCHGDGGYPVDGDNPMYRRKDGTSLFKQWQECECLR